MGKTIRCCKLNKDAESLDFPPLPGELGQRIFSQVSKEAWQAWLKHQTMLINEQRLNLADSTARAYLRTQVEQYFFGAGADQIAGYVPPASEQK